MTRPYICNMSSYDYDSRLMKKSENTLQPPVPCVPCMPVTVTTICHLKHVRLLLGRPPIHRFEKGGPPSDKILRKHQTNTFNCQYVQTRYSVWRCVHSLFPHPLSLTSPLCSVRLQPFFYLSSLLSSVSLQSLFPSIFGLSSVETVPHLWSSY